MNEPGWIQFEPSFESVGATLKRTLLYKGTFVRVEHFSTVLERTFTTQGALSFEGGALVFAERGSFLYRPEGQNEWRVAANESATFAEGPVSIPARFARGSHELLAVLWPRGAMPILERWLAGYRSEGVGPMIGTHPIHPAHSESYRRIRGALDAPGPTAEQTIAGATMELAALLTLADNAHSLAAVPANLSETMMKLVAVVRSEPARPWPLKEAADFAGYSPFHFSRIFKQQVGMGFHEFVDRTRTELAVKLLTTTDDSIDYVASESGFGTAQGLRESVKEYLGLVPSELRASDESS